MAKYASVPRPSSGREGHHFTIDIWNEAIRCMRTVRETDPRKPYFLFLATGAARNLPIIRRRYYIKWNAIIWEGMMSKLTRRSAIAGGGLLMLAPNAARAVFARPEGEGPPSTALKAGPVWVYDPWSAYEGYDIRPRLPGEPASDTILTEALAMRELDALAEMKANGARIDYYHLNGFWADPDGGNRIFDRANWPNGPDRWLEGCRTLGIKPGLWMPINSLWHANPVPAWRNSIATKLDSDYFDPISLFEGGYLADFVSMLEYWYGRGVRMFDLDVMNLDAATAEGRARFSPAEIRSKNKRALRNALAGFRKAHPDIILTSYTGHFYEQDGPEVMNAKVDKTWLDVLDAMMCGEAVVSNSPQANFARALDMGPDPAIRAYVAQGIPLSRIDPIAALISTTYYGYGRGKEGWKGMILFAAARGCMKIKLWGRIDLLGPDEHRWFGKVQRLYAMLGPAARTWLVGGDARRSEPYGYATQADQDALCTMVNPTQAVQTLALDPDLAGSSARLLFHDAGFIPALSAGRLTLGPGQMAVVGFGRLAGAEHDLGVQYDVRIPKEITRLDAAHVADGRNALTAEVDVPPGYDLRIVVRQSVDKAPLRTTAGVLRVSQAGRPIVHYPSDRYPFYLRNGAGDVLSWKVSEVLHDDLGKGRVKIRYSVPVEEEVTVTAEVFAIRY